MKERLHTVDHILFTVLNNKFGAETRAMEFSKDFCRVDYVSRVDLRPLKKEIEKEVNNIVRKNLKVKFYNLSRDQAEKITDLSFVPKSVKEIKIYEIEGFNKLACGGPHVKNTIECGKFKILKIKKKGKDCYSIRYTVNRN